uniref:PPUP7681 n=1 Tax=Poeciliopsis prolifica TaxID=188132 RepID=A0A0S7EU70_9TELE
MTFCPLSQAQPHYLQQGTSESCSDPDSTSYEGVDYSSQPLQRVLVENQCQCCYQRHEQPFDLWENPTHKHPPAPPVLSSSHAMVRHTHSSSSSSSCNSRRVIRCRARVSGSPGGSGSERSQLVQKEMCLTEQVEERVEVAQDGETQVEVCKVN